jgi:hypothetical protein
MSRTRREKNPDAVCGADWSANDPTCPHVCHLPRDHDGDHYCCPTAGGTLEDLMANLKRSLAARAIRTRPAPADTTGEPS